MLDIWGIISTPDKTEILLAIVGQGEAKKNHRKNFDFWFLEEQPAYLSL